MKKIKIFISIAIVLVTLVTILPQEIYANSLSTKAYSWGYTKKKNHSTPSISKTTKDLLNKYDAYYVHKTKEKVIYLTFDLGYENGYTTKILDILAEHEIKATFFVTKAFIDKNPKGLKRMFKEGNVVANHTVNHIPFYDLSESEIKKELKRVENSYKHATGENMVKIVRPPEGSYSEKSLALTKKLGYTTIFWSIALANDWNLDNQPSREATLALFQNYHHNGAIVLLHGISPAVANNLDKILTQLEDKGYEFRLVTDMIESET